MQAVYTVDGGGAAVTTHKFKRPKTTTADRNIHNCNILILAISVEKSSNSRSPVRARNKRVGLSARGALHARPLCLGEEERERERASSHFLPAARAAILAQVDLSLPSGGTWGTRGRPSGLLLYAASLLGGRPSQWLESHAEAVGLSGSFSPEPATCAITRAAPPDG